MVGDNPESDIRGAVNWRDYLKYHGRSDPHFSKDHDEVVVVVPTWEACLVRTGVWDEEKMPLDNLEKRKAKPDTVQDDVKTVLNWVLEKEGWPERLD